MTMHEYDNFDPFAAGELSHTAPLTPEQEEIWLSIQFGAESANLSYNESVAISLEGPLDAPALERAMAKLSDRHEALRCALSGDGREVCILRSAILPVAMQDLTFLSPSDQQRALASARSTAVTLPFNLQHAPLARCTLVVLGPRSHQLIFTTHHIICDGWSGAVLVNELGTLYSQECDASTPTLAAAPQLTEYAALRATEESTVASQEAHRYWANLYRDTPSPLELPIDRPRPAQRQMNADRIDVRLRPELVSALKQVGAQHGASFVAVMLAAFQVFLHRITGQPSVTVALPAAGQAIADLPGLVGHCVRTLPLRADFDATRSFLEQLLLTRRSLLDAMDHPQVSLGTLIKHLAVIRDPSRPPLAAVMFNVDPDAGAPSFHALTASVETLPRAYDNFEWFINAVASGTSVTLETTFNTTLFERASIERRMAGFVSLLDSLVATPRASIASLAVMPNEELAWVLGGVNATERPVANRTLVAQFIAHANDSPDRLAVSGNGRSLTYRELDEATAALALSLRDKGIGPNDRVGVLLARSVDLVVALLGVMRTGAAYVPLDPQHPRERLRKIASDAAIVCCIIEQDDATTFDESALLVTVDSSLRIRDAIDDSRMNEPAYVMYTSGSTGTPKGVIVEHSSVSNLLESMANEPGLTRDAVFVVVTTHSFDISVLELFLPLTSGATVIVATDDEVHDGIALASLLARVSATHLQATPAGYRMLIDAGWNGSPNLTALVGGEALSPELAAALRPRVRALWNCYGPTETTIWSTVKHVTSDDVAIGKPIANTRVYVLDASRNPAPLGVTGELYISGRGVARGYWNRDALTAECFMVDPYAVDARMYKTGDLARLRHDGELEWLGRADSQVKVRGHRIELGDIESHLAAIVGVRESIVIVREDQPNDQRIVAYVRPHNDATLTDAAIRQELRRTLPQFMVPQHVVMLITFPLNANGKVDRRALPRPDAQVSSIQRVPSTPVSVRLAHELFLLVGVARIGMDDDFFALGGHSLLALKLTATIRSIWDVEMPLRVLFASPTLQGMSDFVDAVLLTRSIVSPTTSEDAEEFVL